MTARTRLGIQTLLLTMLAILAADAPASAATILVNTKHDIVADDGFCSLREAVSAANENAASGLAAGECQAGDALPTLDEIHVPKGKYRLTLGAPGDDLNAGGDLDVTESVVIEGAGRRKTRIENGLGDRKIPGDGDRLLETIRINDDVDLYLRALGLRRGDVGCDTPGCIAGASALELRASGRVVLTDVEVAQNSGGCTGFQCGFEGHTAAIRRHDGIGAITLRRTRVTKNSARCTGVGCHAGSSAVDIRPSACPVTALLTLEESRIEKNTATCRGDDCVAGSIFHALMGRVTVLESAITKNRSDCQGTDCRVEDFLHLILDNDPLRIEESEISKNILRCSGLDCETGEFLQVLARGGDVVLRDSGIVRNQQRCATDACSLFRFIHIELLADYAFHADRVDLSRNALRCVGFRCDVDDFLFVNTNDGELTVVDTTARKNVLTCKGEDCDIDELIELDGGPVSATRVDVSKNTLACTGLGCDVDYLVDWYGNPMFVDALRVERNRLRAVGFNSDVDELVTIRVPTEGDTLTILDSIFDRNRLECIGDDGDVENILSVSAPEGFIGATRITGNRSRCIGIDCVHKNGGGIQNAVDDLSLVDSIISHNETGGDGAGLYNFAGNSATLLRTTIEANRAGGRGGAIFNAPPGPAGEANVGVLDSLLVDNEAAIEGGGIYNAGNVLSLAGTILSGNTPAGTDCVNAPTGAGCP